MKITIDGKEIKLTEEQINTLKEVIKKEEEKEWPQVGDEYYLHCDSGNIEKADFENDCYDKHLMSVGNFFRTKEEAEKAGRKRIALATIWKYWRENCAWEVDWKMGVGKFSVYYDHYDEVFGTNEDYIFQNTTFLPYYQTDEQANQAIKDLKKEYLLVCADIE